VQDEVAESRWCSFPGDSRIGIERYRRAAFVHDLVADCEEIPVVDGDGAAELKTITIVIDERHRMVDAQCA
jgi:hypothetical protein